jgi:hypothetical protein
VDALAEARTRHSESLALRDFLQAWPDGRFKMGGGYLRVPRGGDGAPPPLFSTVLDQLRQDAAPPQEPLAPPAYAAPLHPAEREFVVSGTPLKD